MRVGINLINFGPGASPESLARAAELGEALGYHLLMISDHVAITPDVQARYPAPLYDPFTTLGWLAGLTRRVELGTTVIILPYRHPHRDRAHGRQCRPAERGPLHPGHRRGLGAPGVRRARRAVPPARAP